MLRIASTKSMEMDLIVIQINFSTHQPVRPKAVHLETISQDTDAALIIGATQVDDATTERP